MFNAPTAGRIALTEMVIDAGCPLLVIVGHGLARHGETGAVLRGAPWLLLLVVAFPMAVAVAELYKPRQRWSPPFLVWRAASATAAVLVPFALAHLLVSERSETFGLFALLGATMGGEVVVVRIIVARQLRRAGILRSALVLGAGWAGRAAIDCAQREPRLCVRVCGLLDDDPGKRNFAYKGVRVVGTTQRLREVVEEHGVDLLVVAISTATGGDLIQDLLEMERRGVEVVDMPLFFERATGQVPIRNEGEAWRLYGTTTALLDRSGAGRCKRLGDILVSLASLVLSLPLFGILALLLKLDSRGPVFMHQERVGQNERPFPLVRFRTRREDAAAASGGPAWPGAADHRVTRLGRWLRRTGLEEIPQFVNVLRGEMSCIGPRPERPEVVESHKREVPYYALRFSVKPGLTGWAQVQNRGVASCEDAIERLKFDLYYVKNMSCGLDLWIALKSLRAISAARGA